MKTTFDLPETLVQQARTAAMQQRRPLRDLVVEALYEKLSALASVRAEEAMRTQPWKAFKARLQRQPDGSYVNPAGIEDESFFQTLEAIRAESRGLKDRDPFSA